MEEGDVSSIPAASGTAPATSETNPPNSPICFSSAHRETVGLED